MYDCRELCLLENLLWIRLSKYPKHQFGQLTKTVCSFRCGELENCICEKPKSHLSFTVFNWQCASVPSEITRPLRQRSVNRSIEAGNMTWSERRTKKKKFKSREYIAITNIHVTFPQILNCLTQRTSSSGVF
jgi:hypothetical protein